MCWWTEKNHFIKKFSWFIKWFFSALAKVIIIQKKKKKRKRETNPHNSRSITCMSVYSLVPESRFKCYCCRWNFEKNNRIISRIFASMCRPWSWMWGSCSCHDKKRGAVLLIDVEYAFNSVQREEIYVQLLLHLL